MANLIYENRSFLNRSRIESDGDLLIFTRKNISGENRVEVKITDIQKIRADKKMMSRT